MKKEKGKRFFHLNKAAGINFLDNLIILCYNIHIIRKMFTGSAEKVKSIQFRIQGKAKALKK